MSSVARRSFALAIWLGLSVTIGAAPAAAQDVGVPGPTFPSSVGNKELTAEKPESKLWHAGGSWFASLWSDAGDAYHIFRLDWATQQWIDTGTVLDTRPDSKGDALWLPGESRLYYVSHIWDGSGSSASAGQRGEIYRYSYNAGTQSFTADPGFLAEVNAGTSEALTVAKDTTGTLWVTWVQDSEVYVNHSVGGDDTVWGTPYVLPVGASANVSSDDLSAVIAFEGQIGVLWSDQNGGGMHFAIHTDGTGDSAGDWDTVEAYSASQDDHLNLKGLQGDGAGHLFAAIKTSSSSALIVLLVCRNANTTCTQPWEAYPVYTSGGGSPTRPILVLDTDNREAYVFVRVRMEEDPSHNTIAYKKVHFDDLDPSDPGAAFPGGRGTVFIRNANAGNLNDPSASKQNVNGTTDMVVLATDSSERRYYHNFLELGPAVLAAEFSGTPLSGADPLTVDFTDLSTGNPTGWSWDFGDPASGGANTSSLQNPSHTYNAAGTYTVSLTVSEGGDNDTETKANFITVATPSPPTAEFVGAPTGGPAALLVNFTDQSTGVPTTWSWDFGDPGSGASNTSSLQHPSHTYTAAGTYTVTLTVTNGAGNDTETKVDYITVSPPPPPGTDILFVEAQTGSTTSAGSVTTGAPLGASGTELFLAAISGKPDRDVTSVTGLGLTWTPVRAQCAGRDQTGVAVWMAYGTAAPGTVTATFASAPSAAVIVVSRYTGVDPVTPIGAVVSGNSNGVSGGCSGGTDSGAYNFSLTTTAPDAVIYGAAAMRNKTHEPGAGYTERAEVSGGSGGSAASLATEDQKFAATGAHPFDGTFSSNVDFAAVGVEIRPGAIAAPEIDATPTTHDFGEQLLNAGVQQVFSIDNLGDADLEVDTISLEGADAAHFSIDLGGASFTLAPTDPPHDITIGFSPTTVGVKNATLRLANNDPDEDPFDIALMGEGVEPDIDATLTAHDFGDQFIGTDSPGQAVTISNVGTGTLDVTSVAMIGANPADFVIDLGGAPFTLTNGPTHDITVHFTPSAAGARAATLQLVSNDPDEGFFDITLTGNGLEPDIDPTPAAHDFGTVAPGGSAGPQAFSIGNLGNTDLDVTSVSIIGADAAEFAIDAGGDPFTVASGGPAHDIDVSFNPLTAGAKTATLRVVSNDPDEDPLDIALSGLGSGPDIDAAPTGHDYGEQLVNTTVGQTFSIDNVGDVDLDVTSVTIIGPDAAEFGVSAGGAPFTLAGADPAHDITVDFTPTSSGAKSATLRLASNDPDENPLDLPLAGMGIEPDIASSATSHDFGSQLVGTDSAGQTFTISNIGTGTLDVTSVTIVGANPGDFVIDSGGDPFALTNGPTHDITVHFAPAAAGARAAILRLLSNDPDEGTFDIALSGTGVEPDIAASATSHDFGSVVVGNTAGPETFSITNTGDADLDVSSVTLVGTDPGEFSIDAGGAAFSIAPGGAAHDIMVSLSPTSWGAKSASLRLISNDPDESPFDIALSGEGTGPDIDATPAAHDYGERLLNTTIGQTFSIDNLGNATLDVASVTLIGANLAEFSVQSGGGAFSLAPADPPHDITIDFTPTTAGAKVAAVRLASNDPDEDPFDIALTGTGVLPDIDATPSSRDFGAQQLGTPSVTQAFTISNVGTGTLDVTGVTLVGAHPADFVIDSGGDPFSLAPGPTHDIVAHFRPLALGPRTATLQLTTNDPDEGTFDIALSGTGIDSPPAMVAYQETQAGGSTSSATVTTGAPLTGVADHLYLAAITSKPHRLVTGVAGLGLANWTEIATQCGGRSQTGMAVWMAHGPATNGTVTATFDGAPSNAVIAVSRYSDVDTTDPIGAVVFGNTNGEGGGCSNGSDGAAYALGLTTTGPDAVVYGAAAMRNKTHTAGPDYTERIEAAQGSGGNMAALATMDREVASASPILVDGVFSSNVDWAVIGVELRPNSGPPPPPVANFTPAPVGGPAPLTVDFTDTSTGNPTIWSWDFDDPASGSNSSSAQHPSHTFSAGGTYSVSLTATNGGGSDTVIKDVVVTDEPQVTITAPADGASFTEGDTIGFAGTATDVPDGDLTAGLSWTSSLEAGPIGAGGAFDLSTLSAGVHVVTASVTDSDGQAGQDAITITVNAVPTVTITAPADGSGHDSGTTIDFTATATDPEDGTLTAAITWTSSLDGAFGTGGSVSTATLSVGVHTITASVTDSAGAPGSSQISVTVNLAVPTPDFVGVPTSGTVPLTVDFTDLSTGEPTSWDWTFGDGGSSTAQDPSHEYTVAGTYTVSLTATNAAGGDTETKNAYIQVDPAPPGGGQVTFEESQAGASSGLASVATGAALTGANNLYLAAISSKPYRSVVDVTGLGLVWTQIKAQCAGRDQTGIELWMAHGGATGGTVGASFASAPQNAVIAVARYSGVATSNPIGPVVSANTNGLDGGCSGGSDNTAYDFSVGTTVTNATIVGGVAMRNKTHTPGAGYVTRAETSTGSGGGVASVTIVDQEIPAPTSASFNGTFSGTVDWAGIAVEVRPGAP